MTFRFDLKQVVRIEISDEVGQVTARAEYVHSENTYLVKYKNAQGVASNVWFPEQELETVNDFDSNTDTLEQIKIGMTQ